METKTIQNNTEEKLFFSENGGFICYAEKDRRTVQDGVSTIIDAKPIRFTPTTNHGPGRYSTSDPVEIEYLENHPAIMNEQEFMERSRTPEQKLAAATSEYGRKLEEKNRLIEELLAKANKPGPQRTSA